VPPIFPALTSSVTRLGSPLLHLQHAKAHIYLDEERYKNGAFLYVKFGLQERRTVVNGTYSVCEIWIKRKKNGMNGIRPACESIGLHTYSYQFLNNL